MARISSNAGEDQTRSCLRILARLERTDAKTRKLGVVYEFNYRVCRRTATHCIASAKRAEIATFYVEVPIAKPVIYEGSDLPGNNKLSASCGQAR